MVEKTTNSSTEKKPRNFLTSAARADAATASSSKATRSPMSFRWQDAPEGSVSPNGLTFACGREVECARRRWLPLSDGERYRGCTAAERRITWPQRSGISARACARTQSHTYTRSLPRYLSATRAFMACARAHTHTDSINTPVFTHWTFPQSNIYRSFMWTNGDRGGRHRSYSIASLIYNTGTKKKKNSKETLGIIHPTRYKQLSLFHQSEASISMNQSQHCEVSSFFNCLNQPKTAIEHMDATSFLWIWQKKSNNMVYIFFILHFNKIHFGSNEHDPPSSHS